MIWRNPFFDKNSEKQTDPADFLSIFDCSVLKMINEEHLNSICFISSTPGAGKTTLFRAFLPEILNSALSSEDRDDLYDMKRELYRMGIVCDSRITLLCGILSCATGYSILDEMIENAKRKQVFFALLNYRIAIILVRNIASLFELERNEYDKITFMSIPPEMLSESKFFENGAELYKWACSEERRLCRYLDGTEEVGLELPMMTMSLIILRLFEPGNVCVDGEQVFHNVLIILDDFHKLSQEQKQVLSDNLYLLKANVGVWLGQRLEGVDSIHIISQDGSLDRDYKENIVIENYWNEKRDAFRKMLGNIADRRVARINIGSEVGFQDYLDTKKFDDEGKIKLERFISDRKKAILSDPSLARKYDMIIKKEYDSIEDESIVYECITINEKRLQEGQMELDLGIVEDADDFMKKFVKDNRSGAWFYICRHADIPFYFSYDNLKTLSSYNVEQFLGYAGAYYDGCRAKVIGNKTRKGRKPKLSIKEQEIIIMDHTAQLWNDMDLRYSNMPEIKQFLNKIAEVCQQSRDAERNSYGGGAYTGIGITDSELKELVKNNTEDKMKLLKILGQCLASRYFERRDSKKEITVFYLNRWLCVHYGLPLAYGGYKPLRLINLINLVNGYDLESFEGFFD